MPTGSTRTLERRQLVLADFQLQISGHISLKRSTLVDYFLIICDFNYVSTFWGRVAWETELLLQLRNGTVTRRPQKDMFRYVQIFRYLSFLRYLPCLSLWCLSNTYCNSTARTLNALSVALQLVMPLFTADFYQNFAPDWLRRHQQLKLRIIYIFFFSKQASVMANSESPAKKGENRVWLKCVFDSEQTTNKDCFLRTFVSDAKLLFTLFWAFFFPLPQPQIPTFVYVLAGWTYWGLPAGIKHMVPLDFFYQFG